jgi:site-specific DNA-methyltransferase (adenine-specific)
LPRLPSESVDLICTDPPYGIGYMAKQWDTFASAKANRTSASPIFEEWWTDVARECLRVLKPGAFMFVLMTPRQDSLARAIAGLEAAGFNIAFTSLYWTYASGFPKAVNIGKAVEKRAGRRRDIVETRRVYNVGFNNPGKKLQLRSHDGTARARVTDQLEGSFGGFQPKPAVEVVVIAMKPLGERTFVDQALANRKGVTWLDDCRIPLATSAVAEAASSPSAGRFPANLLVSDDVLNDGKVRKGSLTTKVGTVYGTSRGSGYLQTKAHGVNHGDSGSYSRYFSLDEWAKTLPFLIVPKARSAERNKDLPPCSNKHPTVKPLELMSYLITLGSRPGDLVLDPFVGSGTTALAAKLLGRGYIGIERDADFARIAKARVSSVQLCSALGKKRASARPLKREARTNSC